MTSFKPAWWLKNPHLQTIWPTLCRPKNIHLALERERIELPDGDFIDVDWVGRSKQAPIVIILHGLEGSIHSPYAKGMMRAIEERGWRGLFIHFRGCSGEPNRLPRGYHSGDTDDLSFVVKQLSSAEPNLPLAAIGFSLGGNVLLKWLGETQAHNPLKAAIAVSVPFDLRLTSQCIQRGFARVYQWYFLKCLRRRLLHKFKRIRTSDIDFEFLSQVGTLQEFDERITAPLHGFKDAEDYYTVSSSRYFLSSIQVPTLIVQAKDDPLIINDALPAASELAESITLELTEKGGHIGFISGRFPWSPQYWLEQRVPEFLSLHLSSTW